MHLKFSYNKLYNELWSRQSSQYLEKTSPLHFEHPIIENFFVVDNLENKATSVVILPDLSAHIIIHQFRNGGFRVRLIGPRSSAILIDREQRNKTIIVRLKPGSLFSLTSIPTNEFIDQGQNLESSLINLINQDKIAQLITSDNSAQLFQYFFQAFKDAKIQNKSNILSHLNHTDRNLLKVNYLSSALGISNRYLQKITNQQFGLSPKMVLKIYRFLHSLEIKTQNPTLTYAHLAIDSGYYDQSHMIDEYQQFMNCTPVQIFG